ncbi:MAG: hypothetical protein HUU54_16595 [Ignavibacteriaceae bacterium]|nr:hypothetical protein [Ignavibacteriaceae bacterium]
MVLDKFRGGLFYGNREISIESIVPRGFNDLLYTFFATGCTLHTPDALNNKNHQSNNSKV